MIFHTEGLLSKWGFSDGDLLDDLIWDAGMEEVGDFLFDKKDEAGSIYGFDHTVLVLVLLTHVLPVLDQKVETRVIGTIHNPLRATTVDGMDVRDAWFGDREYPGAITPAEVEVPDETILALARSLIVD